MTSLHAYLVCRRGYLDHQEIVASRHRKADHCDPQYQFSYSFYGRRAMAGFVEDMLIQFLASRALRAGAYHHGRVRIPHSAVPLLTPSRKQRSLVSSHSRSSWCWGATSEYCAFNLISHLTQLEHGRTVAIPRLPAPNMQALGQIHAALAQINIPSVRGRARAHEVETRSHAPLVRPSNTSALGLNLNTNAS